MTWPLDPAKCPHSHPLTELARSGDEETWQTFCQDCGSRLSLDDTKVTRPIVEPQLVKVVD